MRTLAEYAGKYVLLYFYPKDGTPGCTIEAQGFRDQMNDLVEAGVQVVGVSADTCGSHKRFAEKHELDFPLLADTETKLSTAYGVWRKKILFGKKYMGIKRQSFLIDPDGVVVRHYEKVDPKQHPQEVLHDIRELSA